MSISLQLWLCQLSGFAALLCLLASQSLAPLRRLGRVSAKTHLVWRRRLGICAAVLASGHVLVAWSTFLAGFFQAALRETPWTQLGLVAWILLLLLWLTSYGWLVKLLRIGHWRHLHRLAYAATLWALLHALLAPWSRPWIHLTLLSVFLILFGLRFVQLPSILKR